VVRTIGVMEKLIEYTSSDNIKGYLEVIKIFNDGREEVHFSDKNVITSGMGATLLQAFNAPTSINVKAFQIVNFQVGVSGSADLQVSSTGALSAALTLQSEYGANASFETEFGSLLASGVTTTDELFGIIPWAYIKKLSPTRVLYTLYLDENTCNGLLLNEIGLFSFDPYVLPVDTKLLCAYRYFTSLAKQDSFAVLFRWVIEF